MNHLQTLNNVQVATPVVGGLEAAVRHGVGAGADGAAPGAEAGLPGQLPGPPRLCPVGRGPAAVRESRPAAGQVVD